MMNCKRAKLSIALAVGNDLDDAAAGELRQHLAECTSCRTHRRELENSFGALQMPPDKEVFAAQDSVWPTVLGRLPSRREQRFNGWIPAAALAAAALMMISIINEPPQYGSTDGESYAVPGPLPMSPGRSSLPAREWSVTQPGVQSGTGARPLGNWGAMNMGSETVGGSEVWLKDPETGQLFGPVVPLYNR